ncbi:MAG: CYTH domain-containing protein [candidate division SR1 bacterium]|nr:CYTH domain-containing protein [candidate division SR1 bacterium]
MALEIERKFLIKNIPMDIEQFPHKEIIQGYFNDPTTGKSIRVRHIGEAYKITRKKGFGLVREEIETDITKEEFDQLRFQVENHFLEKTRYDIPYEGVMIELDIYKNLQGLKTAEIEFSNKRDAKKFETPEWFGEELTRMREASNGYIANHGLSDELIELIK